MDPAEQRLLSKKVFESERSVAKLLASPPLRQRASLLVEISVQQQYFKEKTWVIHLVPHLDVVRESLNHRLQTCPRTSEPQFPSYQPKPQPQLQFPSPSLAFIIFTISLPPNQLGHVSFQPVGSQPASAPSPFLGTCLALGGPSSAQQALGRRGERLPVLVRPLLGHRHPCSGWATAIPRGSAS